MADQYPWGSQAPQTRLSKIQSTLKANERAREKFLESHRVRMAQFEEVERQAKADLRQCQNIIDKERGEANAASLSRMVLRLMGTASPDQIETALKDGSLEQKLAAIVAGIDASGDDQDLATGNVSSKASTVPSGEVVE